jgi:hypothetical protein
VRNESQKYSATTIKIEGAASIWRTGFEAF